jgi:hypothetical protein
MSSVTHGLAYMFWNQQSQLKVLEYALAQEQVSLLSLG